jgi:hypothetical protein
LRYFTHIWGLCRGLAIYKLVQQFVVKFMTQTIKNKVILTILVFSLIGAAKTLACDCPLLTTEKAFEQSKAVFSGEVVGYEYRKGIPNWFMDEQAKETGKTIDYETLVVKVRVNQWWKGEPPTEVYILTSKTRYPDGTSAESSCDYTYHKGETYLVFATKFNTKDKNDYRTSDCLRTQKLSSADEDLKILGDGQKPLENKDEPNISMDVKSRQGLSDSFKSDEILLSYSKSSIKTENELLNLQRFY